MTSTEFRPVDDPSDSGERGKSKRISVACTVCRSQKMRCSGGNPCERCRKGGHACVFEVVSATAKPVRSKTLTKRSASLSGRITILETAMEAGPSFPANTEARLNRLEQIARGRPGSSSLLQASPLPPGVQDQTDQFVSMFFLPPSDDRYFERTQLEELYASISGYEEGLWDLPVFSSDDIINRGIIKLDASKRHWARFFERCASRFGWKDDEKYLVQIREEQPCLFAAMCSVGARLNGNQDEAAVCLAEAARWDGTFLFMDELAPRTVLLGHLKSLLVLMIAWNEHAALGTIVSLVKELRCHTVFAKLTDVAMRGGAHEDTLIKKGRLWLLTYVYATIISIFHGHPKLLFIDPPLIRQQAEVLCRSHHTQLEGDQWLLLHVQLASLVDEVGVAWQEAPTTISATLPQYIDRLDAWWGDAQTLSNGRDRTNDSPASSKYILQAYHLAKLYIHKLVYSPVEDGQVLLSSPATYLSAHTAFQCAHAALQAALDIAAAESNALHLALPLHIFGMPLCLSTIFELASVLPGSFDLVQGSLLISRIRTAFCLIEVMQEAGALEFLALQLQSLAAMQSGSQEQASGLTAQRLDDETRRQLDILARTPLMRPGVFADAACR